MPLTDAIPDRTTTAVDVITHTFSDSKNYVIGPTIELRLPAGFSVEADALYHPITLTLNTTVVPSLNTHTTFDVHTAEIPILGKYRFFHAPLVKPYVEAGPVFRLFGPEAVHVTHGGFAMGAGIELKALLVRISPEIRYIRWGSFSVVRNGVTLAPNDNQAQFLIGLSF